MGDEEFYNPDDDGEQVHDHGGWTGGEFTLGSSGKETVVSSAGSGSVHAGALSRREVLARAAEERFKKTKKAEDEASGSSQS